MKKVLNFILANKAPLTGILAGFFAGYLYWYHLACFWGTYPGSSEWWVNVCFGGIMGGFIACLVKEPHPDAMKDQLPGSGL